MLCSVLKFVEHAQRPDNAEAVGGDLCDLHDAVTQTLISLHLSAQAAVDPWDTQPAQADPLRGYPALDTVRHLASDAATEMRALLVDLHDAVLE